MEYLSYGCQPCLTKIYPAKGFVLFMAKSMASTYSQSFPPLKINTTPSHFHPLISTLFHAIPFHPTISHNLFNSPLFSPSSLSIQFPSTPAYNKPLLPTPFHSFPLRSIYFHSTPVIRPVNSSGRVKYGSVVFEFG